jgi:hypothetical protein
MVFSFTSAPVDFQDAGTPTRRNRTRYLLPVRVKVTPYETVIPWRKCMGFWEAPYNSVEVL